MPSYPISSHFAAALSPSLRPAKLLVGRAVAHIWALVAGRVGERARAWESLNPHLLSDIGESPERAEMERRGHFWTPPLGSLGVPSATADRLGASSGFTRRD